MSKATITQPGVLTLDFAASHTTYRNAAGEKVPGVTTVLGMLNKPALLKWAWQQGKDGKDFDRSRQHAADVGTIAHGLAEAHLRGLTLDTTGLVPDMLGAAQVGFDRFRAEWERAGLTLVHAEMPMVSEHLQVGGTLDILATTPDLKTVLWDIKTSKGIYDEMLIQVATYAAMYEEVTGHPVDECWIVRIGKEHADDMELRRVENREARVKAFGALAEARRLLKAAGMKL